MKSESAFFLFVVFLFVCIRATSGSAQWLFLVLCKGVIHVEMIVYSAQDSNQGWATWQAHTLHPILSITHVLVKDPYLFVFCFIKL